MTMQIAAFCQNSIIIAGDTQYTKTEQGLRTGTNRTKFINDEAKKIYIATSRDE